MPTGFPGFPAEGIEFLSEISRHNNRDWFLPRKPVFEASVKQPMRQLVEALNGAMKRFAPDHVTDPDRAIMRFYRDTRFSKDKSPYKTNIAANFPARGGSGLSHEGAGYYLSVSHKAVAVAGGIYRPDPKTLLAVRNHIAEHHKEFRKTAGAPAIRKRFGDLAGDQLTRVPKGFAADHPAADLLRLKQYVFYVEVGPEIAATPAIFSEVRKHFEALAPFVEFLNASFTASHTRRRPDEKRAAKKKKANRKIDARDLL